MLTSARIQSRFGRSKLHNQSVLGAQIHGPCRVIVEFAELEDFIDMPVKFYSSGMHVRLGFSVLAHLEPEVLLVDEILAVGDMAFQKK